MQLVIIQTINKTGSNISHSKKNCLNFKWLRSLRFDFFFLPDKNGSKTILRNQKQKHQKKYRNHSQKNADIFSHFQNINKMYLVLFSVDISFGIIFPHLHSLCRFYFFCLNKNSNAVGCYLLA